MSTKKAAKSNPLGPGTTNMSVNVKIEFRDACFAAACDARMKLSDWMRQAFEDKIANAANDRAQLKLEGVA